MKFKRFIKDNIIVLIFAILTIIAIAVFLQAKVNFLSRANIINLSQFLAVNTFAALGLTFVIIVGHFDLSFGQVGCLSAMATSWLISKDQNFLLAIFVGLIVGTIWGLLNGILIAKFKLPDMVATIGSGALAFGLAYLFNGGNYIFTHFLTSGIAKLNNNFVFGIPLPFFILIIVFIVCYYLLSRTTFGRRIYAVGDNKITSTFSGIKVASFIITAYVLCGFFASLASIVMTSALGRGNVQISVSLLLPSYTMVYLGIAVFKKVSITGTLLASIFIAIIINGFNLLSVPFYISNLVLSIILLFGLVMSNLFNKRLQSS